jgi:drug/metabolite transporter (DMT)-like permease
MVAAAANVAALAQTADVRENAIDRATVVAFLATVLIGGFNGVAVRIGNEELPFLWHAALRFVLASALLFGVVALRRVPLPRGRALLGSVLYGLVGFTASFALAYYGLIETPASVGMVILSLVPLLTLLLAVGLGLERLRIQSLAGALLAVGGVALLFWERLSTDAIPLPSLLAILGAAVAIAATGIIVKRFPRAHPVANNAVAMGIGGLVLLAATLVAGQALTLPREPDTIAALAYLVVLGSAGLFMAFLFVIERWTASATSYSLLLMPLPAAVGGALLLGEPITAGLLVGGAVALLGVYLGAFAPSLAVPRLLLRRRPAAAVAVAGGADGDVGGDEPALINPGCP